MRILKSLNKNLLYFFLFCLLISSVSNSNEPIDIWKLEDIKKNDSSELNVKIDKSNTDASSNINLNSTSLVLIEEEEKSSVSEVLNGHTLTHGPKCADFEKCFTLLSDINYNGWIVAEMFVISGNPASSDLNIWRDIETDPTKAAKSSLDFMRKNFE